MTFAELRIDVVVIACVVSAGIHGALVPDHFREGTGAGIGFVVATVLLVAAAVTLIYAPSPLALYATAQLFAGLIVTYVVVLTTGVPVLHPDREHVTGLALFTKVVEAGGMVIAMRPATPSTRPIPLRLAALAGLFSALAALAVSGGMDMGSAAS